MTEPINILLTLPFKENLISELKDISPRLKLNTKVVKTPEEIPNNTWKDVEILYTSTILPKPEQAPNLRWIQFHWAGIDHVIKEPILHEAGITATTMSGVHSPQMAEYVLLMILAFSRQLNELRMLQERTFWPENKVRWNEFAPLEMRNSVIGIVGYGSVGRQVARILSGFGAKVLATKKDVMHPEDPGYALSGTGDPEGNYVHRLYPPQAIKSMLKECDFVIICVPKNATTENLIGPNELASMKPSAYLIDVSRGGIVDQNALIHALQEKTISGAALDVFLEEPLPANNPLWQLPNVIITPHISGVSRYYDERALELFSENLRRYLTDTPLYNVIDPQKGY
jgi:phosphoglycerate dehydrogenase-like enzyme